MTDLLTLTHEVGFSQCAPVNMDALDPLELPARLQHT